ncbi:hypothetical protein [Shivajiella indica]|uniref:Uncharacterized protein n=1 Tax=Shivajiella indica TaxID=872115 RepID=A0ABW5B669_9BACT
MNSIKKISLFLSFSIGLILFGCLPKEKIIQKENDPNINQKEFRSFNKPKTEKLVISNSASSYQAYLNASDKILSSQREKLNVLQSGYESSLKGNNIQVFKEIYYLKKNNLSLKVRLGNLKGLSYSEFTLEKESINLDIAKMDIEIKRLEMALN